MVHNEIDFVQVTLQANTCPKIFCAYFLLFLSSPTYWATVLLNLHPDQINPDLKREGIPNILPSCSLTWTITLNFNLFWLTYWTTVEKYEEAFLHPSIHMSIHPLTQWNVTFSCPPPSAFFHFKSSCNFVYNHHRSWAEAADRCQHDGGIQDPGVSCLNVEVSLWHVLHHQKKNTKIKEEYIHFSTCNLLPNLVFSLWLKKKKELQHL